MYDEIKEIADEGLRKEPKKPKLEKVKQAKPLVTVTTGEGILDENVVLPKEEQVKSVVKKAAAKKVPRKKTTNSTTNVGSSAVKTFGSRKK